MSSKEKPLKPADTKKPEPAKPGANDDWQSILQADARDREQVEAREAQQAFANSRRERFRQGWYGVRYFVISDLPSHPDGTAPTTREFLSEWASRIVHLGEVLKAEKLDHHLETLASDPKQTSQAFKFAVEVFRMAIQGEQATVAKMLSTAFGAEVFQPSHSFLSVQNEHLRRDVMNRIEHMEWGKSEFPVAGSVDEMSEPATLADKPSPVNKGVTSKKTTAPGDAEAKLTSALTQHHKYANGSCLNTDPIGVQQLARKAEVSPSTVSLFFNKHFNAGEKRGHTKYKVACRNPIRLVRAFKLLNDEFMDPKLRRHYIEQPDENE